MLGCVIGFDKVDKADVRGEVVIMSCVEECFEGEESIPTTEFGGASKLELGAVFV